MTSEAFNKIAEGLNEALAITRSMSDDPDVLSAEFWAYEFDECYDIPNEAYFDRAKFDDAIRRLQIVLDRLKWPTPRT